MRIAVSHRVDIHNGTPVQSYAMAVERELVRHGHDVINVYNQEWDSNLFDLYLALDNGRDTNGDLHFDDNLLKSNLCIPTAVWFIDSHGHPDLHKRLAPAYSHVFFAVWDKRDLFAGHKSAHWLPNATDPAFYADTHEILAPEYDFGFFGSKGGLPRANPMIEFCKENNWTYDVRQINGPFKHKWPFTAQAMLNCKILFNHGQKHDGPNLRVLESMVLGRPLITDVDSRTGMDKLFEDYKHYIGYKAYSYDGLSEAMKLLMESPKLAAEIAKTAKEEVLSKHLIKHRVRDMLEVFDVR